MNLKKILSTGLALAGLGTWLVLAPLVIVPHGRAPTANRITDIRAQGVNVLVPDGQGSGVIFHKNGLTYIVTAAHVVTDEEGNQTPNKDIRITQGIYEWGAVVVNRDSANDLALLRLTAEREFGRSAHLARKKVVLPVGTHLLHVGNPLGNHDSYLEGLLSGLNRQDGLNQTSIPCYPGSSGGGIFTTDGVLVGILVQWSGPGLNYFVPHNLIWRWAVENDLQWLFK